MDLNRVVTFVRVVECGTFTAAAQRLGLPTSSVSRSVAKLERELGVVLLERTTRKLALTDAGRTYFERAREAVAGLDEASELAAEAAREPCGIVRLAAPPDVVGKLVAVLGDFVREYPRIHVEVVTTARGAELVGSDVDLAISVGPLEDSALIVRRLGATVHRLYASAEYLKEHGHPRRLQDLERHDTVLHRAASGKATWTLTGPSGPQSVVVEGKLTGDSFQFVLEAVAAGHGIGLLPEQCLMHSTSAAAPLRHVLPEFTSMGSLQSLVSPSRHLPRRVRLLRDFVGEHLLAQCPGGGAARRAPPARRPRGRV